VNARVAVPLIDQGSGPPLLVFHGWSGSNRNVERWLPALAPRFRVIVPDLPGCDGAPPLGETHTADAYAGFGVALLDRLGVDDAYVGGLCSGSAIALAFAGRAPERSRGLLLHTPFLRRELLRPLIRLQLEALASPLGPAYGALRHATFLATLHRRLFANAAEVTAEQLAADQTDLVRADARAARELATDLLRRDRLGVLGAWRGPVGVLVADADAFIDVPAVLVAVREAAPQAAVEMIAGGHGWTAAFVAAQHEALVRLAASLLS
jgi:pimeloyl-ACP methyl ester carboxylesterase